MRMHSAQKKKEQSYSGTTPRALCALWPRNPTEGGNVTRFERGEASVGPMSTLSPEFGSVKALTSCMSLSAATSTGVLRTHSAARCLPHAFGSTTWLPGSKHLPALRATRSTAPPLARCLLWQAPVRSKALRAQRPDPAVTTGGAVRRCDTTAHAAPCPIQHTDHAFDACFYL